MNSAVLQAVACSSSLDRDALGWLRQPIGLTGMVSLVIGMAILVQSPSAQASVFSGKRPDTIGVRGGHLAPCPNKPNCVNSQSSDTRHAIAPLKFSGDGLAAMARARSIVDALPGATLIVRRPDYLYAEVRSKLLGFVDDVEFVIDERAGEIQVRSSSRLGYSDFGVNRRRIEVIRQEFENHAGTGGQP